MTLVAKQFEHVVGIDTHSRGAGIKPTLAEPVSRRPKCVPASRSAHAHAGNSDARITDPSRAHNDHHCAPARPTTLAAATVAARIAAFGQSPAASRAANVPQ